MKSFIKGFISFGRLINIQVKEPVYHNSLDKYLNNIRSNVTKNFNKKKSKRNEEKKHKLQ